MKLRCWREWLLSEKPPLWLDILAKSSIVSECVERICMRRRLLIFAISPRVFSLTYTLGFPHGGVRDNLTHCIWPKELEFMWVFDYLLSLGKNPSSFFFAWGKLVCEQRAESGELNLKHALRGKLHLWLRVELFLDFLERYGLYYHGNRVTFSYS